MYEPCHQPGNFSDIKLLHSTEMIYQALKRTVSTSYLLQTRMTNELPRLHMLILLMLSSQIESNPGPNGQIEGNPGLHKSSLYLCGICETPVTWDEKATGG